MIQNTLKNIFIVILLILLLLACSEKTQNIINKNNLNKKGLEYTQIKNLVYLLETKAIINITYLNISYPKEYNNKFQNFLLGIYIVDDNENNNTLGLKNTDYQLSLNDNTKYIKKQIDNNDTIYENIPVKNPYAIYYIVSFDKNKAKTLNLKFSHKIYGTLSIINKSF
jgi:hypothetical protein